jgi:hypothetical protein
MKNSVLVLNIILFLCIHTFLVAQEVTNNKIERILSIEPNIGFQSLKLYGVAPNYEDKKAISVLINPYVGFFIFKNMQIGVEGAYVKVKSDFPNITSGEGYSLGYFIRYNINKLNFQRKFEFLNKKMVFEGKPYCDVTHQYTTVTRDSLNHHVFTNGFSSQQIISKVGVNLKIYQNLYFNFALAYLYNSNSTYNHGKIISYHTLGYMFTKKQKQ